MAQDERARLRQAGFSEEEIDAYFVRSKDAPAPAAAAPAASEGGAPTQRLRSLAQGASLGLADEVEAAFRGAFLPGQTYKSAIEDVRGKLGAYREERPLEAMGYEVGGGLVTGLAGGARALAATAGRTGLREALKAGARTATTGAIGQGVIGGAAGAEGDVRTAQGLENRLRGGVIGGGIAAALPFGIAKLGRLPGVRDVVGGAGSLYEKTRRGIADLTEGTKAQSFGRMIEPTDATRIQREAAENLPGGVTGPTVASMGGGVGAARTAKTQAEVAAEQGKLRAKQATTARSKAEQEAKEELDRVRQEESTLKALTKQKAGAIEEQGKSRAERLSEISKAAEAEEKAIQRGATAELKQTATATREQAKLAAEEALEEARGEAAAVVGGMRGRQPRGAAKKLQETVRAKQLREAEGHYEALRAVGAPPEPDPEIYKEIFADPALRSAYDGAVSTVKKEARNATPSAPAVTPARTININGAEVPEITLETMDQMRRKILNPPYDPNKVGLTRSQKTQALETINRLEERYLAGFGTDEAAEAVRAARGPYREKFETLEAVRDGLNLGSVKAGKISGILKQGTKELDEQVKRVEQMTPKQRTAFQVGAREWFDRALQESPADALAIAKKFSTEASQRRLALAYGDEAVEALRAFAPDIVGKRQAAAAARVREEGAQLAQQITGRAEAAAMPLRSRAERAAALAERAKTQKGTRAEQIIGQRQADASRRLMETQRATGAQVSAARKQATQAQEEAGQLAESLTQARVAATQAKNVPFGDLSRALGTSTQQQTFLQRLLPQMTDAQRAQAVEVLGSNVQRELQDMARAKKSPAEIMRRIEELQQNDVVRALFAPQAAAFGRQLTPTIGTRIPQTVRPTLSGLIGRRIGSSNNE